MRRVWLCLGCCVVACSTPDPLPKASTSGDPWPEIPAEQRRSPCLALTPIGANLDYATPWAQARAVGVTEPGDINLTWAELEPTKGTWSESAAAFMGVMNSSVAGARVALTLSPITTTNETAPADLDPQGEGGLVDYADPEVAVRYVAALEHMMGLLPGVSPWVVAVGNEVDVTLQAIPDPAERAKAWEAYRTFVERVRVMLRETHPGLQVGVKLTWETVVSGVPEVRALIEASDLAIVSYYPIDGEAFRVRPPNVVEEELERALAALGDKPMYLAELGYPSSPRLGSGLEPQSEFVERALRVFHKHRDRIPAMCLTWMNDLAPEILEGQLAVLPPSLAMDPNFRAYFETLGLRDALGQDKPAFERLRQWNTTP